MAELRLTATADADGVLRLSIPVAPAGGQFEVVAQIVVRRKEPDTARRPTPEELGWPPGFLEGTFGSIDDETFVAPPRQPPRPVPSLDDDE